MDRRSFLQAGGALLAGLALRPVRSATSDVVPIRMISTDLGGHVSFDPIGLYLRPGQTARWHCMSGVHTTTAYHPANDNHSLRIPEDAEPWDSGYLQPGATFEYRFTVPGVYDYYCMPHEAAGMVGRIVVGKPAGPGTMPFDYFRDAPGASQWRTVPQPAQSAFPPIAAIMRRHVVRAHEG